MLRKKSTLLVRSVRPGLGTALKSTPRSTDGPCHEGKPSNAGKHRRLELTPLSSRPSVGMYKTGDCRRVSLLTFKKSGLLLSCPVFWILLAML